MSFRMIYVLPLLLMAWLILDQLTVVNVRAANFLQQQPAHESPILSENIESKSYALEPVNFGRSYHPK